MLIGVDEVGLGAWAGPLVVCAFAAPDEAWRVPGLNDSKKLSKKAREAIAKPLMRDMVNRFVLVSIDAVDIDDMGIGKALPLAMERAILRLIARVGVPDRVIVDGEDKGFAGAEYYPKADGTYPCVMAASVVAKVYRDDRMADLATDYPLYDFEGHVGYGTPRHLAAMQAHGLTPYHRRSYAPMQPFIPKGG